MSAKARRLTGKWSGNGKMTHRRGKWVGEGKNGRGHTTMTACICVEAKDGRNEKLCGIKRLQGSERLCLECCLSGQREIQGVPVCGQTQSAGFTGFPKWMPSKSPLCLSWACPSLPGRPVVKWALRYYRSMWEVKDAASLMDAQLRGGIWADIPLGPLPGYITITWFLVLSSSHPK